MSKSDVASLVLLVLLLVLIARDFRAPPPAALTHVGVVHVTEREDGIYLFEQVVDAYDFADAVESDVVVDDTPIITADEAPGMIAAERESWT